MTSLRHPFGLDPGRMGTATESSHPAYVEQLIRQVIFTGPGERINRPDFGCGIRRMVFAPNSDIAASLAQVTVFQALEDWLGEWIRVDDVKVDAAEEVLEVRIIYMLRALGDRRYLNLEVTL